MTKRGVLQVAAVIAVLTMAGCSGKPGADGLRDSFAQQLKSNRAVKDFQRSGDDLSFSGPGVDGSGVARWRVHIDSAVIEVRAPYKGTVKSSWYANDQVIKPSSSGRDSNLPVGLTDNGLAQDCYALWDPAKKEWGW
jgi:hypothetical protein